MQQPQPMQAVVSFTNPIMQTGKANIVSQSPYLNNPLSPNKSSADGEGSTHDSSEGMQERTSS